MRAVVTGGAGFIGSHLAEHLVKLGHEVIALDDLSSGRLGNLTSVLNHEHFTFVEGSILDERVVDQVMAGCDTVFHLAAALGVQRIVDEPVESLWVNLHGTECVLRSAVNHGCRFLFTSSSEVYGRNNVRRLAEDADRVLGSALKSRWSYASAKALDEMLAYCLCTDQKLAVVIVRLFNVVGPRQTGRYGMVVPRFVDAALSEQPLTVFGSGGQTRCFCSVTDIVPALVALIEQPSAHGQAVNLGGTEEVTIGDLARTVRDLLGSRSDIVHIPYEAAYGPGYEDVQRRVPDTTRARRLIGFCATVGLEEIIRSIARDRSEAIGVSEAARLATGTMGRSGQRVAASARA